KFLPKDLDNLSLHIYSHILLKPCGFHHLPVDLTLSVSTSQVFAIVVFGTISDQGYYNPVSKENGTCMFNNNECACGYAVGIGVLAFVACVELHAKEGSAANFKLMLSLTLIFLFFLLNVFLCFEYLTAAGTFLWFICFCVLANQWARTNSKNVMLNAARAAIAFSFFSIITWVSLTHKSRLPSYCVPSYALTSLPTRSLRSHPRSSLRPFSTFERGDSEFS
uniref:MARVEL domain-containing protein n=1 Tax=Amphilophus citrinellus TaxID=61819 RepID=A0A3Q0S4L1_AMPCI